MRKYPNLIPDNVDKPEFFNDIDYSYLTVMGSRAYGTHNENSDYDFYGFIVPPVEIVFPHLAGYIGGFGRSYTRFEQYQAQHIEHPIFGEIDLTIYNIVKYFQLVMDGNPNMVDSLFTREESVVHCDNVGELVKNNRHIFLSEKMFHTFKGMAWQHMSRLKSGHVKEGRKENEEKYGYDTKDAYHTLRCLLQIREVLRTGDLHIGEYSEYLVKVRHGYYSLEYIVEEFKDILKQVEETVREGSAVPHSPNEKSIKDLLVACLEMKYGSLSKFGFRIGNF